MEYIVRRIGEDELEHYGRLGMKWGQHIFGKEKAYNYSIKKLNRLDTKAQKKLATSAKRSLKADKYRGKKEKIENKLFLRFGPVDTFRKSRLSKKSYKQTKKAYRALKSSQRAHRKAEKWAQSMNQVFSDIKLDTITDTDVALSRKYVVNVLEENIKNR